MLNITIKQRVAYISKCPNIKVMLKLDIVSFNTYYLTSFGCNVNKIYAIANETQCLNIIPNHLHFSPLLTKL